MTSVNRSDQRITTMLNSKKGESKSEAHDEYVPQPVSASSEDKGEKAAREPRFNPFEASSDVIDLSMPNGPAVNFRPTEIRFHSTKTVGTGSIRIDSKKNNSVSSFDGFFVRSYSEGEDPEYRIDAKSNKKVQRFAMTGKQSVLPELHRAAAILILDSNIVPELNLKKIISMSLDNSGYMNICDPQAPRYSNRTCYFGKRQFALHIKDSVYTAASGHKTTYKVCVLEREKSEEAKKTSKSQDATFYVDFPARKLMDFYKSITRIMAECNLQPLEIEEATLDSIFSKMKESGYEPDPRALDLVRIGRNIEDKTSSLEGEEVQLTNQRKRKNTESSTADTTVSDNDQVPFKKRIFKDGSTGATAKVLLKRPLDLNQGEKPSVVKRFKSMELHNSDLEEIQRELNEDTVSNYGDLEKPSQGLVEYEMTDEEEGLEQHLKEVVDGDCDTLRASFSTLRKLNEKKAALKKKAEATKKKLLKEVAKK